MKAMNIQDCVGKYVQVKTKSWHNMLTARTGFGFTAAGMLQRDFDIEEEDCFFLLGIGLAVSFRASAVTDIHENKGIVITIAP